MTFVSYDSTNGTLIIGFVLLEQPGPVAVDGEVDIAVPVRDPEGRRLWVLLEARARLHRSDVRQWDRRLHDEDFPGIGILGLRGERVPAVPVAPEPARAPWRPPRSLDNRTNAREQERQSCECRNRQHEPGVVGNPVMRRLMVHQEPPFRSSAERVPVGVSITHDRLPTPSAAPHHGVVQRPSSTAHRGGRA